MRCPTCSRNCDEYKRHFSQGNLRSLRAFVATLKEQNAQAIPLDTLKLSSSELIALRNCRPFGLISPKEGKDWMLTTIGNRFLGGTLPIPSWLVRYNGEVIEESPDRVYVDSDLPLTDKPKSRPWRGMELTHSSSRGDKQV